MSGCATPQAVQLAIGRIFRMASRPEKPGDTAAYFAARSVIMAYHEGELPVDRSPNWARDRGRGAQGDAA
jgi:hypothetical protein